ncbi:orotate phosphoribosyltransferase [Agrilactobacillus fermenti]|uniref:orotate phosphoribosyltransferase n=1 Tax=Agrilactobacillus fermenti TaxID=2586909 RepID=UPI001E59F3BD|nr:orotate phosphoribosyltransferase [Agrilactobacillus fermenti]MCD2256579.1 orotate phosphoribosyltransferase [Agrilactobacillus fermenti]
MNQEVAKQVAKDLLSVQAVFLQPEKPFTWASGLHSPIYCDNRITLAYPIVRKHIAQGLADMIAQDYSSVEVIAGTATAGIPHAAWVADLLGLPMVYIRSKPKDHGKGNQIEGHLIQGQKMVVIDDLLSTGGSVLAAANAAKKEGAEVIGVAGIFSYQLRAVYDNFKAAGIPFETLTNYETLIDVAVKENYIGDHLLTSLKQWREDPETWSHQFD